MSTHEAAPRTEGGSALYPGPYKSAEDILEATRALGPQIRAAVPEIGKLRRLPEDLAEALREAGVWRATFPAIWNGPEMSFVDQIKLIEEIARNDASTAWASMILLDSGFFAGNFSEDVVREIYPSMDMGTAVSQYPLGRADLRGDTVTLNGRFRFGSGTFHADVIGCPCLVYVDGEPKLDADGKHEAAVYFVPADKVHIFVEETWHVVGLQGSGSFDYEVKDVEAPAHHMYVFDDKAVYDDLPPLSRHHRLIVFSQWAVLLGVALHMLEELKETVKTRIGTASETAIKDDWQVQVGVVEAEGLLSAARAYAMEYARETDDILADDSREMTREHVAKISMVGPTIAQLCRRVADIAIELVGTDALMAARPWEQLYEDLRAGAMHVIFRRDTYRRAITDLQQKA